MKVKFISVKLALNAILSGLLLCGFSTGQTPVAQPPTAPTGWGAVAQSRVYDVLPVAARGDSEISLDGTWQLAEAKKELASETIDVADLEWKQVQMPATIQYALFQAGAIENPWYGENWKKLQWIQEKDWYLRRSFQIPAAWSGRHMRLRFDGMDYVGAVWLDGKLLGIHEGALGGPTFDISQSAVGREHEIVVRLIHETDPLRSMKPWAASGQSYQWVNRFRTVGLWRSIRVVRSGQAYMEAPWVRTDHIGTASATLWAQTTIANLGAPFNGTVQARIVDLANGKTVWQQSQVQRMPTGTSYWERSIELANPKIWWPNGMGGQPLYRLELSLAAGTTQDDSIHSRFGIRTIEVRRNPYLANKPRSNPGLPSWLSNRTLLADKHSGRLWKRPDVSQGDNLVEDDAMFNSDEAARYLFIVNGRPVYMKGVNWVSSDDLLASTPQREGWLMKAARLDGINLFRLNGGVENFESEQFYNLCDEAGILVWQEFPLTFSESSRVPLSTWREQAKQSVLRIRQHPSLAIYVGGNEFKPFADGLSAYMGMSREIVAEYDDRPFRISSPNEVEYHAYYDQSVNFDNLWIGDPNWYLRYYGEDANFIGEWSFASFGNMSTLKRVIPAEELARNPVGYDIAKFFITHPMIADRFAEVDNSSPLIQKKLSWYGDLAKADLAQYVEYSQMAQADVYGYVFENWRAQFPYKGGETVWTYNALSPSSGWNMIDWFGQPQISYYSTKRADEPVHVMADTNFFSWGPGSTFHGSVFAVNEGDKALLGTKVTARILDREIKPVLTKQWELTVPPNGVKSDHREVSWHIPADTPEGYFFLELTMTDASGRRISRRAYWLRVLDSLADPAALAKWQAAAVAETLSTHGPWLRPQVAGIPTTVSARMTASKASGPEMQLSVVVKNTGDKPAYPVQLDLQPDTYSVLWSDNYFWLDPGESVTVTGTVRLDMKGLDPVAKPPVAAPGDLKFTVSAWNAAVSDVAPAGAALRSSSHSPPNRFVIAPHSPHGELRTGLHLEHPEKHGD